MAVWNQRAPPHRPALQRDPSKARSELFQSEAQLRVPVILRVYPAPSVRFAESFELSLTDWRGHG